MPVEKTNRTGFEVIDGACFAYYDETFNECLECFCKEECRKATMSENVKDVRRKVRNDENVLKELIERFKE